MKFCINSLKSRHPGFSMVELLVSIAVIAVLGAASVGAVSGVLAKGAETREIAAGKTLITAYLLHASENNGRYLPSFDPTARDVLNDKGAKITMTAITERYPFRLAPYFEYKLKGAILVNDNEKQIKKQMSAMYDYGVSAFPAFGINRYLVGGLVDQNGNVLFPSECITRQSQADFPVIAFTSAGTTGIDGYEYVKPPNVLAPQWASAPWVPNSDPGSFGSVRTRKSGKAVCVYLDGSIKQQTIDELRDMRFWSRNAALKNDPNYVLTAN